MQDFIEIKNAHIHNLKGIDVKIPRNKLTVITGVSGSGKSSLAFDTLYEEGRRRYLMFSDTQFIVDSAPSFDSITGLSPTIAVEQRVVRQSNPRSTVGTRTKISNMLAALYAAFGERSSEYDDGKPLTMEIFQKNSQKGMCVRCLGSGIIKKIDEDKLFQDMSQKLEDVCLGVSKRGTTKKLVDNFYKVHQLSPSQTLDSLSEEQLDYLKYGDSGKSSFIGYIPWILQVTNGAFSSTSVLENLLTKNGFMQKVSCPKCKGTGVSQQAIHTTIKDKTIAEMENMELKELYDFLSRLEYKDVPLVKEILSKLECLVDVGLYHLTLARPVPTLSGGEIQRLFLASYIIAEMDSIIFIFDEPTIGLHQVEKGKLIKIIKKLVDRGNTVVAVEHDEQFMKEADYIVDLGPLAGIMGGEKIFEGSFDEFLNCKKSNTACFLNKETTSRKFKNYFRPINREYMLHIEDAVTHNLRHVTVDIPLGLMVGVAGVSGSGKSSLVSDTLVMLLKAYGCTQVENDEESLSDGFTGAKLSGVEKVKKCIVIDQKPIGRSRSSCPATYTGIWDRVREIFAKESGLNPGFFSVNSTGGCKVCKGDGIIQYHIGFGQFIEVPCEECSGTGFVSQAMAAKVGGKTIIDILKMTVDEAFTFFKGKDEAVERILTTLRRVGLGYITLGQKTPTISGGESQRIKLAKELSKGQKQKNIVYILDEPTTGLSFHDSEQLLKLLEELVDNGNTVIVTEHDTYILSQCDYIIEMGIGGGREGGNVIACGTPKELTIMSNSIVGRYLK